MPIPNTDSFSLQDVVDEINPTTDDLVDCFADADANLFDPLYEGSKNSLLNFRNYGNALKDKDGNAYTIVEINGQQWIVENLRVITYADDAAITNITVMATWAADTTGAYCYYDNDAGTYEEDYGCLYNWYAVDNASGLAYLERGGVQEAGWRVPTKTDYEDLETYLETLGSYPGGRLKEIGTSHWDSPNSEATDQFGFLLLPGGYRRGNTSDFYQLGTHANLWSATDFDTDEAYTVQIAYNSGGMIVAYLNVYKYYGRSVRLVRDIP